MDVSNGVVATMRFSVEDKHFIKWLRVSEKCEAEWLIKMFPVRKTDRRQNFGRLNTYWRK